MEYYAKKDKQPKVNNGNLIFQWINDNIIADNEEEIADHLKEESESSSTNFYNLIDSIQLVKFRRQM